MGSSALQWIACSSICFLMIFPSVHFGWDLTLLSSYYPSNHELMDVEIAGDYAYVPGGLNGLDIIDISNPHSPTHMASYIAGDCEWGRLYAWRVQGNYAYGSGRYCGIKVLDVTSPSAPEHIGDYGTEEKSYEHADVNGVYLYAATHADGIEIVDISTPQFPEFVSSVPTDNAWAVDEYGGLLYVADGAGGLKIVDVSNPEEPQPLGQADASGTAKDVAVEGNYVFVAVGASGVDMFDVSDPLQPILVVNYNTTGYASRVAISDSLLAVSDWDDVEILKWDGTPSLLLAGYKNTGGRTMAINMVSDIVFSAEWTYFRVFQFESIVEPDLDLSLRKVDFPYTEIGDCRDTTLCFTNNGQTELILVSTDVDNPDFAFSLATNSIAPGDKVEGTLTYCATSEDAATTLSIESNDPDEETITVVLQGNTSWGLEPGEAAPDFTLSSVNGFGDITLSDLQGQAVIITFFALF